MKNLKLLFVFGLAMSASTIALAESSISWNDPESYRDVDSADQSQKKFQQSVFKRLDKYLNKLSKVLPEGQKLWLKVNDLDLAGKVLLGYAHGFNEVRNLRVIKRIDFPKMKFSFHLTDKQGKVIKSGDVVLKDMGFQDKIHTRRISSDSLGYEKQMLKEWFNSEFAQLVAMK